MSVRLIVRSLSELCITAGTVIVLFVGYVVHWTGVKASGATDGQIALLQEQWARGTVEPPGTRPAPVPSIPSGRPAESAAPPASPGYRAGKPFAVMYIPRFGRDWDWPVLEGTGVGTLKKGLGHYPRTAALGRTGNFSVAGHRRTYGDPFKDFPELRPKDAVVLTDGTTWYTYRIVEKPYRTVPTDIGVVDPVPKKSPFVQPGRYLTLTTCDPEWGSSHRLIAWARLETTRSVTHGKPEALRG
ncbi:class E sortase [Streptomyces qinzhouensis]|uniref:Class E sortase n=1 Tax=Streptomyces qinzhouensis TaxID=2599401 RepID=A0A5B8J908_9ACTN|nr:class E sortase [Streptomyces qinzhouensis]QDY77847.1 class E sortase [Streptomyces qinzhouensis]